MTEWVIGIWALVVIVIALNGFGAGFAAALHGWQPEIRRRARLMIASLAAGMLPSSFVILAMLMEVFGQGGPDEEALYWAVLFVIVLSISTLVSVPGALLGNRLAGRPGDDYRSFE